MLEALLTLIGALVGGIITVQYMYAADRRKVRAEVVLEVVSFCDDIFHLIQLMHVSKGAVFTRDFAQEPQAGENYQQATERLTVLLKTSVPRVKLAIAYGEGDALRDFNALTDQFREVASILRRATRVAWVQENREIHQRFADVIDPTRARLESRLLSDARPASIWVLLTRS
jgi:hypothetical protein